MEGTVKHFLYRQGHGFIAGEDGIEYFVHFGDIVDDGGDENYRILRKNERVSFTPADSRRGPKAVNVRLLTGVTEANKVTEGNHGQKT